MVSIPDVPNPDEVIDAVGTTAQLQFRPVNQIVGPSEPAYKQDPFKAVDCTQVRDLRGHQGPTRRSCCAPTEARQLSDANSAKLLLGKVALGDTVPPRWPQLATTGQGGVATVMGRPSSIFSGRGGDRSRT